MEPVKEPAGPIAQLERVSDHSLVASDALWGPEEVAIVCVSRHLAVLQEVVMPQLKDTGVKVVFVTMGSTRYLQAWLDGTHWPAEMTYLDQDGLMYKKLGAYNSVMRTFFDPKMWFLGTIRRFRSSGLWKSFLLAARKWRLAVPEKKWQSFQQGGTFVARGQEVLWSHKDKSPGDYPNWSKVVSVAIKATGGKGGGVAKNSELTQSTH